MCFAAGGRGGEGGRTGLGGADGLFGLGEVAFEGFLAVMGSLVCGRIFSHK